MFGHMEVSEIPDSIRNYFCTPLNATELPSTTGTTGQPCRTPPALPHALPPDSLISEVRGVGVEYSHPVQALQLAQLPHQLSQPLAIPPVHAVCRASAGVQGCAGAVVCQCSGAVVQWCASAEVQLCNGSAQGVCFRLAGQQACSTLL